MLNVRGAAYGMTRRTGRLRSFDRAARVRFCWLGLPAMSQPMLSTLAQAPARLAALPPLALYVHVPWCVRKCPYCDFNSHELRGDGTAIGPALDAALEARYVDALAADLEHALPKVWGRKVHSVFFGGGTPSLLSAPALDAILSAIRARLPLQPEAEITLEANPGTFEAVKFGAFRALGVNRLSIGIQSFHPRHLQALGRIHDREQALRAVESAQATFDNFNLDLMYALPGQSLEEALADLGRAIDLGAPHVSAYHLTLEPNTYFHRFPPPLPDDETSAQMQEQIEARLADAGYVHYETSAFGRPGRECRHNLNYWRFGDYLGIGAGAHGKISFPDRIVREMRWKNPREYVERTLGGEPVQEAHEVAPDERAFEFMMNALRLTDGVPLRLFEERTGLSVNSILQPLARAEALGLIERDHATLKPTLRGQRFLNDLLQLLLPDAAQ
jgi:oxygen-independent coproporphyrinogen-3 oxidase